MRKQLIVTARHPLRIRKVEIEHLAVADAVPPYRADRFTARGAARWRPPLDKPVYTHRSATWWGTEFPASRNAVRDGMLVCGYLTAVDLAAGDTWPSHPAVVAASEGPALVKNAFLDCIEAPHPQRTVSVDRSKGRRAAIIRWTAQGAPEPPIGLPDAI